MSPFYPMHVSMLEIILKFLIESQKTHDQYEHTCISLVSLSMEKFRKNNEVVKNKYKNKGNHSYPPMDYILPMKSIYFGICEKLIQNWQDKHYQPEYSINQTFIKF